VDNSLLGGFFDEFLFSFEALVRFLAAGGFLGVRRSFSVVDEPSPFRAE
jgi:hypothetical protein